MRICVLLMLLSSCSAQTLTFLTSPTQVSLRGVSAASSTIVWASGTHGTYLRTIDAGKTWSEAQVPGATELDFRDVVAFSADEAFLMSAGPGPQSRVYHTTDGGAHWTLQLTNAEAQGFYDCMAFWDRSHGILVGDPVQGRFELMTTEDEGAHWTRLPETSRPAAEAAEGAFAASGSCIAVQGDARAWFVTGGPKARVFLSTDRGRRWRATESTITHGAPSSGIFSVVFRDAEHGLIAGGDYQHADADGQNLAESRDGGATWTPLAMHPQFYFSAIAFLGVENKILAVGSSHILLLDLKESGAQKAEVLRTFDAGMNAIAVTAPGTAILVGPGGKLARFSVP
jgi:photosystem II stability/assembly factor-like uncharacterized protein